MNGLKQNLDLIKSIDEKIQIFQDQSITSIENLSNEIFYDIFDYLNGDEIVKSFLNLNFRFEQIIHSSSFLTKTHFYLFHYDKMMNTSIPFETLSTDKSNLNILSIHVSRNLAFVNAKRWEKLISVYYPQLKKFYLTCSNKINEISLLEMNYDYINEFNSLFWLNHEWILDLEINACNIIFQVHPYKRLNNLEAASVECFQLTSLTITCLSGFIFERMMLTQIEHVAKFIKIYNLIITEKEIPSMLLIRLIVILPDLMHLNIKSIMFDDKTKGWDEWINFHFIRKTTKITDVYIHELNSTKENQNISQDAVCKALQPAT
ncbi:unnamed protein product [Adineta steineri]|uniref:F-box domain-containing protein n=1 Tax=Adineta steineri TaxID=433720 RepID=A0A813NZL7_9BILA|nr:unnamed protein product [Adineta steineri]CAF4072472.1 unnamed protein product [Adineta steineri]